MNFLDVLVSKKILSKDDANYVRQEAESGERSIEEVLRDREISPNEILLAKSEALKIPMKNLEGKEVPFEVLKYIPEESALHYKFIPFAINEGVLEVGLVDPDNIEARDALSFIGTKANMPFKIYLVSEEDFERVLASYKGLSGEVTKALSDLESEFSAEEVEIQRQENDNLSSRSNQATIIEDAPVTKIVATILRYAIEGDASDVHIEHMRDKIRVRFRVDGILNTSLILPINVHPAVVARIKILCNMKLDEKRKPQDGRFSARIENRKIDFRVSTFPAYYGEKIVMRILDQEKGVQKLDKMGISPRSLSLIKEAITRPYGMILISGPTGSGKTTTLYSMLNELNMEEMNVLSLEDPVEYNIDGMSQSQVRPEIGYTFASGLRTTLRQDPDVIMVGEIRDKETAQLAVQAALTGHLVLSTIHTNSAVGVIPRLVDMGVDPYLIAPTLILTMAQRLVGKICPDAVKEVPFDGAIKVLVEKQFEDLPAQFKSEIPQVSTVYEISPTPECPKGTRGRTAVFEAFKMDRELEALILKDPTEVAINKLLREKGMMSMREDAIIKALRKEIPFEEVNAL
ncbi:MAG: GspE/PulE family protein [Candidatus Pacebacteria bacterium]|nr:GspE/PulE family protein [Candidatus Paceibacterota bacterium]